MQPLRTSFKSIFLPSLIVVGALSSGLTSTSLATSADWTGGGIDALWSNTANWSTSPVPTTTETATFNAAAGAGGAVIDLTGGVTIRNITFDTASVAAYTIGTGGAGTQTLIFGDAANTGTIQLTATAANNQIVNSAITLGTTAVAATYNLTNANAAQTLTFNGNITGGSGGVGGAKALNVSATGTVTVGGNISKGDATAIHLTKTGAGLLNLNGATSVGDLFIGRNGVGSTATMGSGATATAGTSASNNLYVGTNTGGSNPVGNGTFNARDLTAKVGIFGVGYSSAPTSAVGTSTGVLALSEDGTIQADNFYVGVGLSSGAGGNFKTNGSFSLTTDATLDLSGTTGAGANLIIGWSHGGSNASQQIGSMDLSAGAADLTLSLLRVGRGSNSVSGTGTLTLSGSHTNHLVVSGSGTVVTIGETTGTASTGTATLRNLDATSAITSTNNSTAIVLGNNHANATGNLTLSGGTLTITTTGSAIAKGTGKGYLTLDNMTLIAGASNTTSGKWITGLTTATFTNTVTFDSGVNTISTDQVFTGAGGLTKDGAGTLTLSGANTFSGQLRVQAGTLAIATINNASSNGVLGNSANAVSLGNTGSITGTLQYTGIDTAPSSTKKFTMAAGGTGAFQIDNSGTNLTLSGVIDGTGNLTKTGAGTLTLDNANTYEGATLVSSGTLALGATASLNTSEIELNAGTMFDTTAQSYTIPTAKPVTLHLNSAGVGSSGKIKAASLNITNATVVVEIDNAIALDDPVYVLAEYTSLTGAAFSSVTAPPSGYAIDYNYNSENKIAWVQDTGGTDYTDWDDEFAADLSDKAADFDGDGLSNFQEYAFGLDPTSGTSVNPITDVSDLATGFFTYTRRAGSGLTYTVWTSTDLQNWGFDPVDVSEEVLSEVNNVETVKIELLAPPTGPTFFVRVKAD